MPPWRELTAVADQISKAKAADTKLADEESALEKQLSAVTQKCLDLQTKLGQLEEKQKQLQTRADRFGSAAHDPAEPGAPGPRGGGGPGGGGGGGPPPGGRRRRRGGG